MFLSQQDEYEAYKKSSEEKIKNYSNDIDKLFAETKELKEKNAKLESDLSLKNDKIETLENEKRISEEKLLEKKQSEDIKIKDFYSEIHSLETQLEESKQKNKEISEKQSEDSKIEREGYQKVIKDLKSENFELNNENKELKKNLEEKESELKKKFRKK